MNSMPQEVTQTRAEINNGILLERMYLELRPRFLASAYSILRNREDSEDAVQEAFASAHRNFPGFEGRSAVATWLTRIVINQALMRLRRNKRDRIVVPFGDARGAEPDQAEADVADERSESPPALELPQYPCREIPSGTFICLCTLSND